MSGLQAKAIDVSYGQSRILHGVSLEVPAGTVVTLLGRNGAGKTTTIRALCGLLHPTAGDIVLDGQSIAKLRPDQVVRRGIACVTDNRGIFTHISVRENLALVNRKESPWTLERVLEDFPIVKPLLSRPGGALSGGEQQIVAIARALMLDPRILLLDEPSQGLAPVMVDRVLEVLSRLKAKGLGMLVVEQKLDIALELAEHAYVLENGRIAHEAPAHSLAGDPETINRYLGIGA